MGLCPCGDPHCPCCGFPDASGVEGRRVEESLGADPGGRWSVDCLCGVALVVGEANGPAAWLPGACAACQWVDGDDDPALPDGLPDPGLDCEDFNLPW